MKLESASIMSEWSKLSKGEQGSNLSRKKKNGSEERYNLWETLPECRISLVPLDLRPNVLHNKKRDSEKKKSFADNELILVNRIWLELEDLFRSWKWFLFCDQTI